MHKKLGHEIRITLSLIRKTIMLRGMAVTTDDAIQSR